MLDGWSTPELNLSTSQNINKLVENLESEIGDIMRDLWDNEPLLDETSSVQEKANSSEVIETTNVDPAEAVSPEASTATKCQVEKQFIGVSDPSMVAPEVKILRDSRSKIAAYTEKGITEEVLRESDAILQGDGTSRAWIRTGKIFTTPIKVGGKTRRLGVLSVSKETRDNLKDSIIHRLEMMSIASSSDKISIWRNIIAFLSDKASENPGLMAEIAEELGVVHCPGEFYCLIHSVLGFDRSEAKCFLQLQTEIGVTKLFSNLNYVDMDSDSFDAVNTSLDCISRLISPQFSHKAWSRYRKFSDSMESKGLKNLAFAHRDKRFGGAAACAAVVNYHWEHLKYHLSTAASQQSDRNQLACAVRSILESDVIRFMIVSKAIVGFHLHEPFINSVVEQNIQRSQLLTVLPALHTELCDPPRDVLDLSQPALLSLTSSWSQNCYPELVVSALQKYIDECDKTALSKMVICLLKEDAVCLARQRGPEYNFGGSANLDHPQNVENQLPSNKQNLLDSVPADNLESEHYFGDFTQRLSKVGSKYIELVSDCMTIASSADLAFKSHEWKSKKFNETFVKMKECRAKFNESQRKLRELSTNEDEDNGDFLIQGRKKAAVIQKLKEHQGPMTSATDVTDLLDGYPGWKTLKPNNVKYKQLKSILRQETTYARDYVFDTLKKVGNPLFKLNKLSLREMVENLSVLYGDRGEQLTADFEDVRSAMDTLWGKKSTDSDVATNTDSHDNFKKDDAIVFKSDDNLALGIIEEVHPDELWVLPLDEVKTLFSSGSAAGQLWRYPDPIELLPVRHEAVLPCFPNLELDRVCSSNSGIGQSMMFRVFNEDVLKLFCK